MDWFEYLLIYTIDLLFTADALQRSWCSKAKQARQHKEFIILAFPNTAKLLPATDTVGIHSIQETVAWCLRVKKEDKLSVMVWTAVCTFNEGGYDLQCILGC